MKPIFLISLKVPPELIILILCLISEEINFHLPEELLMVEFDKHILPRFKFKTQVTLNAVNTFENGDDSIITKTNNTSTFSNLNDVIYKIKLSTTDESKLKKIDRLIDWLKNSSGILAIGGYSNGG